MKLRRFAALALTIVLLLTPALTASAAAKRYYISYGDSGDPVGWFQELLGVREIHVFNYRGDTEPYFGEETRRAVRAFQREYGLTVNGKLDANTLYTLLDLPYYTTVEDPLVWIPMYGGTRYHSRPTCSNMLVAREMPYTCAEDCGFLPCARCYS